MFAFAALLSAIPASNVLAGENDGFLPSGPPVFRPLQADPRELQYALRFVSPVSRKLLGEAAIGQYIGLFQGACSDDTCFRVDAGGGVFGRFDLADTSNDMETIDWYASIPLDWRHGKWSGRFMLYHTSAHLGDDYLKTHGGEVQKHSWDNLRWLAAYEPCDHLRLYGGYTYTFRTLPQDIGRHSLQGGIEASSRWFSHRHAQLYWANDFQSWERSAWNPEFTSQAGVRLARSPDLGRSMSVFTEFETGTQPQGQFYLQKETRWNIGIRFDFS